MSGKGAQVLLGMTGREKPLAGTGELGNAVLRAVRIKGRQPLEDRERKSPAAGLGARL